MFSPAKLPLNQPTKVGKPFYRPRGYTGRKQYRRKQWEAAGGIDPDTGEVRPEPELSEPVDPVSLPVPACQKEEANLRAAKVEAFRLRHELKQRIHHPDDTVNPSPDVVRYLIDLGKIIYEEILALRGFRIAAHGISKVKRPKGPTYYRAQTWAEVPRKKGPGTRLGHVHIGYADTEAEARQLVERFFREERGIDISMERPAWMDEAMKLSLKIQSERAREEVAAKWADDDDPDTEPTRKRLSDHEETVRMVLVTYGYCRPLLAEEIVKYAAEPGEPILHALEMLIKRGKAYSHESAGQRWFSASKEDYERQVRLMIQRMEDAAG